MRLWHKDLIKYLPRRQLLSQWRECCCIARNIEVNGTPNHLLVNKVLDYPMSHLYNYGLIVANEMEDRGYKCNPECFYKYFELTDMKIVLHDELFKGWHNDRYLNQCLFNLEEKFDCGGITDVEWTPLVEFYMGHHLKELYDRKENKK